MAMAPERGGVPASTESEQPSSRPPGSGPLRILVVDDHELFVDALARRLEIEPSVELVGRANSTE